MQLTKKKLRKLIREHVRRGKFVLRIDYDPMQVQKPIYTVYDPSGVQKPKPAVIPSNIPPTYKGVFIPANILKIARINNCSHVSDAALDGYGNNLLTLMHWRQEFKDATGI